MHWAACLWEGPGLGAVCMRQPAGYCQPFAWHRPSGAGCCSAAPPTTSLRHETYALPYHLQAQLLTVPIPVLPAAHLPVGVHVLTVTRASEPRYGAVWLKDISIDSLGTFMTPLSPPKGIALNRRILFIGDGVHNTSCSV